MQPVVLATCRSLPAGDEDAEVLAAALRGRGLAPRWQIWDDPDADWAGAALVVLRSTWDYTGAPDRFLAWAASVPRLANPAGIVAWSSDKAYLTQLAAAGVPTVPTAVLPPGSAFEAPPSAAGFVVKPAVGAGSRGAGRFAAHESAAGAAHAVALHAEGRTVLVQPYLDRVDSRGETALVYLAGEFSHAIGKGAMLPPGTVHPSRGYALYVAERITARTASAGELAVGAKALALVRERFGRDPLYARVDLLPGPDGPLLGELELVEPSLFLVHDGTGGAGSAAAFAAAIADEAAHGTGRP